MTEKQEKFLNALFNEANGDFRKAMEAAGYAPTESSARLIRSLKDQIIERAELMMAANAPKAVMSMVGVMDDPSALGNKDRLAASKEILDRVGMVKTEKVEHKTNGAAIVFLPPLNKDDDAES